MVPVLWSRAGTHILFVYDGVQHSPFASARFYVGDTANETTTITPLCGFNIASINYAPMILTSSLALSGNAGQVDCIVVSQLELIVREEWGTPT
jgi:hypothetical protein